MPDPLPILFTIPNFITAGSGQAMLNIIERLDRNRLSPSVCVSRRGGDLDLRVLGMGIPLIEAPFSVPARPYHTLLARAWKAAQVFRPHRFAMWHSFHYLDDYTEPIIARLAGTRTWIYTKKNMNWGGRAWKLRSRFARHIVAQNDYMLDRFFDNQRQKVRLIPRGVNINRFSLEGSDQGLRQQLGFPADTTIVGHVGHFVPVKNHPFLLEALSRTRSKIGLVMAGDMLDLEYVAGVRALAEQLGVQDRIRTLGKVSDVPSVLRAIDIFAFCSHKESCPVAVLEAMAQGLPSVVTDIDAMSNIHSHGQTASVVPKNDVDAFAAALDDLSADVEKRRQYGQAARRHIENNFTIEREAAAHQQLYLDLS